MDDGRLLKVGSETRCGRYDRARQARRRPNSPSSCLNADGHGSANITLEDIRALTLKGLMQPVAAFNVIEMQEAFQKSRRTLQQKSSNEIIWSYILILEILISDKGHYYQV
jgi:hypothetical protein